MNEIPRISRASILTAWLSAASMHMVKTCTQHGKGFHMELHAAEKAKPAEAVQDSNLLELLLYCDCCNCWQPLNVLLRQHFRRTRASWLHCTPHKTFLVTCCQHQIATATNSATRCAMQVRFWQELRLWRQHASGREIPALQAAPSSCAH